MTTSFVYAPIPRAYYLNPMGIWGHETFAQHLHDVATLEHPVKTKELGAPPALYSIPGLFSPWFPPSMGYRRQHTAALFDPTDEIVVPTKKNNHFSGPKESISPTPPSQTEKPAKEEAFRSAAGAALSDPSIILPQSVDPLTKGPQNPHKALSVKDDDDDWVDFSNYTKVDGFEFIDIGATKFRISTPPGSASRLAKILKDRGRWTPNHTERNPCSVLCNGPINLPRWSHPSLVSV